MKITFDSSADAPEIFYMLMQKLVGWTGDVIAEDGTIHRNLKFMFHQNDGYMFCNLDDNWQPIGQPFPIALDEFHVH